MFINGQLGPIALTGLTKWSIELPPELLTELIRWLPWEQVPAAGRVCKLWREVVTYYWESRIPALSTLLRILFPQVGDKNSLEFHANWISGILYRAHRSSHIILHWRQEKSFVAALAMLSWSDSTTAFSLPGQRSSFRPFIEFIPMIRSRPSQIWRHW